MKWKFGFTAARQFGGSMSPWASHKSKCQWVFNLLLLLLLDFLLAAQMGIVVWTWRNKQAQDKTTRFYREEILWVPEMLEYILFDGVSNCTVVVTNRQKKKDIIWWISTNCLPIPNFPKIPCNDLPAECGYLFPSCEIASARPCFPFLDNADTHLMTSEVCVRRGEGILGGLR